MNRFSEHEIEFFKRLRNNQKIDPIAFKFSMVITVVFLSLILIPLIAVIN